VLNTQKNFRAAFIECINRMRIDARGARYCSMQRAACAARCRYCVQTIWS